MKLSNYEHLPLRAVQGLRITNYFPPNRDRLLVVFILAIFIILAFAYSIVTPIFEGFDENWHFAFVQYIASGKGLPQQPPDQFPHLARQEASQPPLYYWLVAALTWWVPDNDTKIFERYNPQFEPIPWDYLDNKNILVHIDAEKFPYQGAALAVHIARFISVLLGTGTVYCTYALARMLFPDDRALAIGAMILAALTPSFIFTSALVNNDVLVTFLASIALVFTVMLSEGKHLADKLTGESDSRYSSVASLPRNDKLAIALGIILGLAALTKLSGLLLWLFVGMIMLISAWRAKNFRMLIIVYLIATVISGWWYVRNWFLYGDATGLNRMLDIMARRGTGFGLSDLLPELEGMRWSYWALFGQTNVRVDEWIYRAFDWFTFVAWIGLVIFVYRALKRRDWKNLAAVTFLAAWAAIVVIGLTRWALMTAGSQGRLLFPAISVISILLVKGFMQIVPRRAQRVFAASMGVALFAFALWVPFFVITPAYASPTLVTQEQLSKQISQPTNVRFGDISMLGYRVESREVKPGDLYWITLCWRGEEKIAEDYLVFAQLLIENDLIAAQKDTYHGLGNFPTSQWRPGEMFCDRYPLRVKDTTPFPSESEISVGLYRKSGERLHTVVEGKSIGDNMRFPGPRIVATDGLKRFDYEWASQIALDDYKMDRTAVRAGENFQIMLKWRALQKISSNYVATIQVLDANGKKIGQSDGPLKIGSELRVLPISAEAEPGVFEIKLGVYEQTTIVNLPLYHNQRRVDGSDLLTLWTLRVLPGQ